MVDPYANFSQHAQQESFNVFLNALSDERDVRANDLHLATSTAVVEDVNVP